MINYGDITKISGYNVPVVDCVVGGSPCQNLSVAGNREGLDGDESKLFVEMIRIIKEMRDCDARIGRSDEFIRPRFAVWENVPGAFSSNKGQDFRVVLESFAQIVEKDASIPMPPKDKWTTSGCIVGDGWSIAWRVLDAQFWGVPQRRRRIALVADFGGGCAQEVLFERQSLRRHSEESRTERKGPSEDAQGCVGVYDNTRESTVTYSINHQGGNVEQIIEDKAGTLTASMNSSGNNKLSVAYGFPLGFRPENVRCYEEKATTICIGTRADFCNGVIALEPGIASREGGHIYEDVSGTLRANAGDNQMSVAYCYDIGDRRRVPNEFVDTSPTLLSKMGTGGNDVPVVVEGLDAYNQALTGEKTMTLTNCATDPHHIPCIVMDRTSYQDKVGCLRARDYKGVGSQYVDEDKLIVQAKGSGAVCYCLQGNQIDQADTSTCNGSGFKEGTSYTLNVRDRHAVCYKKPHYIVRRLTPLECERLQGYPDGWTDIGEYTDSKGKKKKTSDAARYKALGNSIALPPWKWIIKRLCSHYERDATLASLFDGIGGFPCIWEQINGKDSAVWASEIEDFPIAVTQTRIR